MFKLIRSSSLFDSVQSSSSLASCNCTFLLSGLFQPFELSCINLSVAQAKLGGAVMPALCSLFETTDTFPILNFKCDRYLTEKLLSELDKKYVEMWVFRH